MNERLVATAGPLKGTTFPILGAQLVIGRDRSSDIRLSHEFVSRRHCAVVQEGEGFVLKDLGSRNPTLINGAVLKEHLLVHGDEIKIGEVLFIFLSKDEDVPALSAPEEDHASLADATVHGDTMLLRPQDGVYLRPGKLVSSLPANQRLAGNLKAFLEAGEAISSIRGLAELGTRLLEIVSTVIPARQGAILVRAGGDDFTPRVAWRRDPAAAPQIRIPRSILRQVVQDRVSIRSNDVMTGGDVAATESVLAARISSVLAVPLVRFDRVIGAIYLDTDDPAVRFEEDHLQLLTGIAGTAAGALETALYVEDLENENRQLKADANIAGEMAGTSPRMQEVYRFIAKVAPTSSTVLIFGESGTGKELVARAIHRNSPRSGKRFAAINCAALTETLLESELFGHEKGAFTGAIAQKKGKLEEAEGGTVFLDEVGEMALPLQAKLLRVLQEREFERVGGTRAIRADIRLVAATNRILKEAVAKGIFREDLFYRLNVVSITLPPLRERREDLPILVKHFLSKHGQKSTRRILGCSEEALACLKNHDWPGNVRELENTIERAVVLGSTELILPDDLPESIVENAGTEEAANTKFHETIRQMKRQLVLKALEQAAGNCPEAAKMLGLHPNNLYRLMKTLDIRASLRG